MPIPLDIVKVRLFQVLTITLSVLRTQYIIINNLSLLLNKKMRKKFVLDPLSAAHQLAVLTLKLAHRAFYRQYRVVEDQIGLTHGVIGGV